MSGTQGSGSGSGQAPGQAQGQGSPAPAPGAPAAGAPAPGAPAAPPTERLSVRDATKALGQRRREASGQSDGQSGGQTGDAAPPRRRPRSAPAALGSGSVPASDAGAATPAAKTGETGADVLTRLMEGLGGPHAARADAAKGGDAAAGAAASQPAAEGDAVTLEIGGKPQSFTRAQLLDHVLKGTDYTRKSQQLADFARQVQQAQATVAELVPILTPMLEQQIRALEGNLGAEPNWLELARTDPAQYNIKRAEWDMAERERRKLATLQAQQTQQTEAQQKTKLADGHKQLVEALPGWDDPTARGRIQAEIVKWGRANGYPDTELRGLYEPRYVVTMTKAMMFDRMLAGAKTDTPVVPVVQRGSLPPPTTEPVRVAEAHFEERPSVRNAAQLLSARRAAQRGNGRG